MENCLDCEYFKIENGEDLCTRAKCMKTSKRGRTIDWRMTKCFTYNSSMNMYVEDETAEDYLKNNIMKKKIPSWCPEK